MSTTLYYEIVMPLVEKWLPDKLKWVLKDKYDIEQGKYRLKERDIDYLSGLRDAGMKEVEKLISGIKKYGEVDIWIS